MAKSAGRLVSPSEAPEARVFVIARGDGYEHEPVVLNFDAGDLDVAHEVAVQRSVFLHAQETLLPTLVADINLALVVYDTRAVTNAKDVEPFKNCALVVSDDDMKNLVLTKTSLVLARTYNRILYKKAAAAGVPFCYWPHDPDDTTRAPVAKSADWPSALRSLMEQHYLRQVSFFTSMSSVTKLLDACIQAGDRFNVFTRTVALLANSPKGGNLKVFFAMDPNEETPANMVRYDIDVTTNLQPHLALAIGATPVFMFFVSNEADAVAIRNLFKDHKRHLLGVHTIADYDAYVKIMDDTFPHDFEWAESVIYSHSGNFWRAFLPTKVSQAARSGAKLVDTFFSSNPSRYYRALLVGTTSLENDMKPSFLPLVPSAFDTDNLRALTVSLTLSDTAATWVTTLLAKMNQFRTFPKDQERLLLAARLDSSDNGD